MARTLAALLALTAAVIPLTQLAASTPAKALSVVNCTGGAGSADLDPPVLPLPNLVNVSGEGQASFDGCTGGGVTDASITGEGTGVLVTCVQDPIKIVLGPAAVGNLKVTWKLSGGGTATTNFNWTVAGFTQLGPSTSVALVIGTSTSGRYHHPGLPAVFTGELQVTSLTPDCSNAHGIDHIEATGKFQVVDLL